MSGEVLFCEVCHSQHEDLFCEHCGRFVFHVSPVAGAVVVVEASIVCGQDDEPIVTRAMSVCSWCDGLEKWPVVIASRGALVAVWESLTS